MKLCGNNSQAHTHINLVLLISSKSSSFNFNMVWILFSINPEKKTHSEAFHQGSHCLQEGLINKMTCPYAVLNSLKKNFINTIRMSNGLDPDQTVCKRYQLITKGKS